MNIKKGIDRIALVIAILAALLIFYRAGNYLEKELTTVTPEYKEWQSKYLYFEGFKVRTQANSPPSPPKLEYPPLWKTIGGGLLLAIFAFAVVFFGFKGTTRLLIWIVAGFKDEKKQE